MSEWHAEIHVWPYSTGNGRENDQKAAGERVQKITVHADDIASALKMVQLFANGIETGPMVWQAPIVSIARGIA
jgi:hypothetical protein